MITRNDPSFAPDLSEQNLVCAGGMGDAVNGGLEFMALDYFTSTGIVSEAELPYTAQNTSPNWPLQPGWQNRVWKSTSNYDWLPSDTGSIKAELKAYGPLTVAINAGQDLNTTALGTDDVNHGVLLVGYVDNTGYPGGGYWIIKNSWGTGWNGNGYGTVMYGNIRAPQPGPCDRRRRLLYGRHGHGHLEWGHQRDLVGRRLELDRQRRCVCLGEQRDDRRFQHGRFHELDLPRRHRHRTRPDVQSRRHRLHAIRRRAHGHRRRHHDQRVGNDQLPGNGRGARDLDDGGWQDLDDRRQCPHRHQHADDRRSGRCHDRRRLDGGGAINALGTATAVWSRTARARSPWPARATMTAPSP